MDPADAERRPRRNFKAFIIGNTDAELSRTSSISSVSTASLTSILHHESYESGVSDLEDEDYDRSYSKQDEFEDSYSARGDSARNAQAKTKEHDATFVKGNLGARDRRHEAENETRGPNQPAEKQEKQRPKRDISGKYSFENWLAEKRKQVVKERTQKQKLEAELTARKEAEEKSKREKFERGSQAFHKWMKEKQERESNARRVEAEKKKLKAAIETERENAKAERRSRLEAEFRERLKQRSRSVSKRDADRKRQEREDSEKRASRAQRNFIDWLQRKGNERPHRESLAFANGRIVHYYDLSANPPVPFRQNQNWRGVLDTNAEADAAYESYLEKRINELLLADV